MEAESEAGYVFKIIELFLIVKLLMEFVNDTFSIS